VSISEFAGRLTAAGKWGGDKLTDALTHAVERGYLSCNRSDELIIWKWRNYLPG
jgi:hypothetical protein